MIRWQLLYQLKTVWLHNCSAVTREWNGYRMERLSAHDFGKHRHSESRRSFPQTGLHHEFDALPLTEPYIAYWHFFNLFFIFIFIRRLSSWTKTTTKQQKSRRKPPTVNKFNEANAAPGSEVPEGVMGVGTSHKCKNKHKHVSKCVPFNHFCNTELTRDQRKTKTIKVRSFSLPTRSVRLSVHWSFFVTEVLLHIPCWLLYMGSFSYTSCAGFFIWGVFLTHPVLVSLCGEFFLHILCWFLYMGSFSYTSCAGFFIWGVFLTHPVLVSLCGEFFLHILCWFLYVGSFSYTSCAGFFVWGVFLTHPVLASLCGEFFLHILCWLLCVGSFSYTSCAGFFMWGVFLTHPVLASLCGEFFLHILCWFLYMWSFSYTSRVGFFMWRVSLARPDGDGHYKCGVSLTRSVPCWLLYVGNFYNTSTAGFFMWGVSLTHSMLASLLMCEISTTHPMLASFCGKSHLHWHPVLASLWGEFLLYISRCPLYMGSFSYTSRAGFLFHSGFFMWDFSLTHSVLASLCGQFRVHVPPLPPPPPPRPRFFIYILLIIQLAEPKKGV